MLRNRPRPTPLPDSFLTWQVRLRRHTMEARRGAPHAGVAPLLTVRDPRGALGVVTGSIICGVLPAPGLLLAKTAEFRRLYEDHVASGARAVYDRGIDYLLGYYADPGAFDRDSLTTLLAADAAPVAALRADPRASLVFYVFDLADRSEIGRFRCLHLDCAAEIHADGPVFDNVWWHNTLFHGPAEGQVVVRFRHLRTWDTRFGALEEVA